MIFSISLTKEHKVIVPEEKLIIKDPFTNSHVQQKDRNFKNPCVLY
jgi:hypothetical protein